MAYTDEMAQAIESFRLTYITQSTTLNGKLDAIQASMQSLDITHTEIKVLLDTIKIIHADFLERASTESLAIYTHGTNDGDGLHRALLVTALNDERLTAVGNEILNPTPIP